MRRFWLCLSTIFLFWCTLTIGPANAADHSNSTQSIIDVCVTHRYGERIELPIHGEIDDFGYADNGDGTATLVRYSGSSENITIPETIAGLTVTKIGLAFSNCGRQLFRSVVFPETLEEIGEYAFSANSALTSIDIPASVKKIGDQAFYSNRSWGNRNIITRLVLREGLEEIGETAFIENEIEHLIIPESVITIKDYAFSSNRLESVTLRNPHTRIGIYAFEDLLRILPKPLIIGYDPSSAKEYTYANKNRFQDIRDTDYEWEELDGTAKITAYIGNDTNAIDIPRFIQGVRVVEIGEDVFRNKSLSRVSIPEGVVRIGAHAFAGNELENISFPSTLLEVGEGAFKDNRLDAIDIPESWTVIATEAFMNNMLDNLIIPDTIARVEDRAFQGNTLSEVWIMGSEVELGEDLFWHHEEHSSSVHLYAEADSIAQTYALDNGHLFTPWYHVIYDGNGHSSGQPPIDSTRYFEGDQPVVLGVELKKHRHLLIGWNDRADGTGQSYAAGEALSITDRHIRLYAMWEEVEFAGGDGSQENPYLIEDADQLSLIRYGMNSHYKLVADIDLSGYSNWEPIGMVHYGNNHGAIPFRGGLDGNGHVISNLRVEYFDNQIYLGLFSYIQGQDGTHEHVYVRNLGLENVNIAGTHSRVGALAGQVENATVSNVYVRGGLVQAYYSVGGLFGVAFNAEVMNAYSDNVMLSVNSGAGGIVGVWFTTNGFSDHSKLENVYATGTVFNASMNDSTDFFGGIVARMNGPATLEVIDGYWSTDCLMCNFDLNLGEGVTTAQLKQQRTFEHWNFDTDWLLLEERNMLPALRVFHPVELDVQLGLANDVLLLGNRAQFEVSATYKRLSGVYDVTGSEEIHYVVSSGEGLVEISAEGEVIAIAPGAVEVEVSYEGGSTMVAFTIARDEPDIPSDINVPVVPVQGGAAVEFDWEEPADWGVGTDRRFKVRLFDGNNWGDWTEVNMPSWTITLNGNIDSELAQIEVKSVTERGESPSVLSDRFTVMSTPPLLKLLGDHPMTVSVTAFYTESGAIAEDVFGADLTDEITVTGMVTDGEVGDYELIYIVQDIAGNVTQAVRTVSVINDVPPKLTLVGESPYLLEKGSFYEDSGAIAVDYFGTTISVTVEAAEDVEIDKIGAYEITYIAEDSYGNQASLKRLVHIIPVALNIVGGVTEIAINGAEPNAIIHLYDANEQVIQSATADEHGIVLFSNLTPNTGYYAIQAVGGFSSFPSARVSVMPKVAPETPESVLNVLFKEGGMLQISWSAIAKWGTGSQYDYIVELWMDDHRVQLTSVAASDAGETPSIEWKIPMDSEANEASIRIKSMTEHGESSYVISDIFPIQFPHPGNPEIEMSESSWTDEDVLITIRHGDVGWVGVQKTVVRLNDGEFVEYTEPFTITSEGETIIEAYTIDQSNRGGPAVAIQAVARIDRTGPQIHFSIDGHLVGATEVSTVVTVIDEWSGIDEDSLLYMWSPAAAEPELTASEWATFYNEAELLLNDQVGQWYLHIVAKDYLGNISYKRTEAFLLTKIFTLTYAAGMGGMISGEASQSVSYGDNGTAVTAVPDEGYHFAEWSDGNTNATRSDTDVVSNVNVTAQFAVNNYTVSFESNGGSNVVSQTVNHGDTATLPNEPTRQGYVFDGWHTDVDLTVPFDFSSPIIGSFSLYSSWRLQEQVAMPRATPSGGAVLSDTPIILSTTTDSAVIYYTTDGTNPSVNSIEYSEPIEVTNEMTIKAIAVKEGMLDSDVLTEHYTMATLPAPLSLTATPSDRSVVLNWHEVENESSVTYAVYQAEDNTTPIEIANWELVQGHITVNTYIVTGLTNGKTYAFSVKAIYADGESEFSNEATVTPNIRDDDGDSGGGGDSDGDDSDGDDSGEGGDSGDDGDSGDGDDSNGVGDSDDDESSGGSPGGGGHGGSGWGSIGEPGIILSSNGEITIPAGRSGEVSLDDEIIIKVSSGATEQELKINIKKLKKTFNLLSLTDQQSLVSPIFDVIKNGNVQIKTPISLSIKFDSSEVEKDQKVAIFYYDVEDKRWVEFGGEVKGEWVTIEFDHFTKFAVLVVDFNEEDVIVSPKQPEVAFTDITGHWGERSIMAAASQMLVSGYPDGTFKPNNSITRAEFTVMLVKALQLDGTVIPLEFTDQDKIGSWAKDSIALAMQHDIINGYGDGSFRPHTFITRAEMSVMIARALGETIDVNKPTGFADDEDIPHWAKGAVEANRLLGIISGRGNNQFVPNETATRAEAVVMLLRIMQSNKDI